MEDLNGSGTPEEFSPRRTREWSPQALSALVRHWLDESLWSQGLRDSLIAFGVTRLLLLMLFTVSWAVVPAKNATEIPLSRPDFSAILSQGDGEWYLDIAQHGYDPGPFTSDQQKNWAFFPLYPLLIRSLVTLGVPSDPEAAGILLSHAFALVAMVLVWKLTEEISDTATARRTVFYMSAFPTSIFFSAVSNMAITLLLFSASLYFLLHERFGWASLTAGLAALARGQGVFLVFPFALSIYSLRRGMPARIRAAPYLLAAPIALGGFMLYMWRHTGNAFATTDILAAWDREFAPVWEPVSRFLRSPVMVGYYGWDLVPVNVAVAVVALGVVPLVFRRFGAIVGAYTLAMVLGAVSYSSLQAADRYVLTAFPIFMLLAAWGRQEWVDRLVSAVFLTGLGLWATFFAAGYRPFLA